jgi:hypothetical protein
VFISAIIGRSYLAASERKVALPPHVAIDAEVDLGTTRGAFVLAARLNVSQPGLEREVAQALVDAAPQLCRIPTPHAATSRSRSTWSKPDVSRIWPARVCY